MKNDIGIQIYYRIVIQKIVCMIPTLNRGWHLLPMHMCSCLIVEKDVVIGMDVMILSWKQVAHIDHIGILQCLQDCPRDNLQGYQRGSHRGNLRDFRRESRQDGLHLNQRSNHHNVHRLSHRNDQVQAPLYAHIYYRPAQIDMIHQLPQHIRLEVKLRLIQ